MEPTIGRPRLGDWVERHDERCRGGRRLTLLVNRRDGQAIQLSDVEIERLELLEGPHPVAELGADDHVRDLLEALADGGFLEAADCAGDHPGAPPPTARMSVARSFLATLDLNWSDADRFVQRVYHRGARQLFRPAAVAAQIVLGVTGVAAVVAVFESGRGVQIRPAAVHIPLIVSMGLIAVAVHELAHALVVAHNGRSVHAIGFRLHLGTPAFYVDSVEALLLPRRQRLIQAAAGPWAEWLVTSLVALAVWFLPTSWLTPLLDRFIVLNTLTVISNLLPFVGLDGHWLLADAIHEPDLAQRCQGSVGRLAMKISSRQPLAPDDLALAVYATANTLVAAALVITAGFFWWELFGGLVGRLAEEGLVGWITLAVVATLLGRPVLSAIAPRFALAWHTTHRLADRARFRIQRGWRVGATEQLALQPALAGLDDRSLSLIAGRLCGGRTLRRTVHLEPRFTGFAITGPAPRRTRRARGVRDVSVTMVDPSRPGSIRCTPGGFVATIDHTTLGAVLRRS